LLLKKLMKFGLLETTYWKSVDVVPGRVRIVSGIGKYTTRWD